MTTEKPAPQIPQDPPDWRQHSTLLHFLRDVAIAAVILGVGLYLYKGRVEVGKKARALGKEAKEYMLKDSPRGYVEAEKRLVEMEAISSSYEHNFAMAALAELYAIRWIDHGFDADAESARKWAKLSDESDANINERFGAVLMAKLGDKKYEEAEKYAAELTKKVAPSHVVNGYGRALRALGRLGEARIAFKKSADTEWRNPRFACDFADLFFDDGDYVNAQNFYGKGVEANGDHVRSLVGRSRAQIARGQKLREATETLEAVLKLPAEDLTPKLRAQALTAASELRAFEGRFEEAAKAADEAIAAHPAYAWAHFAKGRALAMQKQLGAAAAFDKALELDRFVPEFYYQGSSLMLEAGDAAKAQALLDSFTGALKVDDRYHLAYGNLLMRVGKPEEALKRYDEAIDFNNFNALARYAKGAALFDARLSFMPDPKDATKEAELLESSKKELELALEVQEYLPAAYSKLGDILFQKKEWAEGCQQYAQALIQMKQLQAPKDRMNELRDRINDRLIKDAKLREMAKAWMEETAAFVR